MSFQRENKGRGRVPGSGRKTGSGVMGRSLRVRLPADVDARLVAAAERSRLTQSEYVRRCVAWVIDTGMDPPDVPL